jgi:hypothetical protein
MSYDETKFGGKPLKRFVNLLLECTKWTIIPQLWFEDGLEVNFKGRQETSARTLSDRKQRTS